MSFSLLESGCRFCALNEPGGFYLLDPFLIVAIRFLSRQALVVLTASNRVRCFRQALLKNRERAAISLIASSIFPCSCRAQKIVRCHCHFYVVEPKQFSLRASARVKTAPPPRYRPSLAAYREIVQVAAISYVRPVNRSKRRGPGGMRLSFIIFSCPSNSAANAATSAATSGWPDINPLAQLDRAACKRLAFGVATARVFESSKVVIDRSKARIIRSKLLLYDVERAAIERLGLFEAGGEFMEHSEIV